MQRGRSERKFSYRNQSKVACEIEAQDALNIENIHTHIYSPGNSIRDGQSSGEPKLTL